HSFNETALFHSCRGDFFRRQRRRVHLAAIMQKRRRGGRPVYWASASMFFPLGKRRPISHKFTVLTETSRSAAICFKRTLFRCRHALNTMAKFLRISHPNPFFPAT